MPAGIEFVCPHCGRPSKVPPSLASKQGRCNGCRKVIEVPDVPPTSSKSSGRVEQLGRPSERVPAPARTSGRAERPPSGQGAVAAPPAGAPLPGELDPEVEETDTSTARVEPPKAPAPMPWRIKLGFPLAILFPALGVALCVFGLKDARRVGRGETLGKWGIGIGITIIAVNLVIIIAKEVMK